MLGVLLRWHTYTDSWDLRLGLVMSVKYCIFYPSLVQVLLASHMHIIRFTHRFYHSITLMDYWIIMHKSDYL